MTYVLLSDLKADSSAKMCHKGARSWCEANGVSWDKLCAGQLRIDELEHFEDQGVKVVIQNARKRLAGS